MIHQYHNYLSNRYGDMVLYNLVDPRIRDYATKFNQDIRLGLGDLLTMDENNAYHVKGEGERKMFTSPFTKFTLPEVISKNERRVIDSVLVIDGRGRIVYFANNLEHKESQLKYAISFMLLRSEEIIRRYVSERDNILNYLLAEYLDEDNLLSALRELDMDLHLNFGEQEEEEEEQEEEN